MDHNKIAKTKKTMPFMKMADIMHNTAVQG
jgi:hypothetical protein